MNKIALTLLSICLTANIFGQSSVNQKLIELGKAYKDFMFRNEPPKGFVKDLQNNVPENLKLATSFIEQTITTDNKLLKKDYLILPDIQTLKYIFIIHSINLNIRQEKQIDNNKLIDSLKSGEILKYKLVDTYYSMLFASVGNKNQPFDYSKNDFKLKEYNLSDDAEKGIFFLRCMDYCGKNIWGFMNIAKPANTKNAYDLIKLFPKFNGQPYFQYNDLNFPDFEIYIIKDKGLQSYKGYFLDKYYEVLLTHLICLNKEGETEKEKNDLLLGSILKEKDLYKYTRLKPTLDGLFKEQKRE